MAKDHELVADLAIMAFTFGGQDNEKKLSFHWSSEGSAHSAASDTNHVLM